MLKRWLYNLMREGQVSQNRRDEDEFLTDLNTLRHKWAMRGREDFVTGVNALTNEATKPVEASAEFPAVYRPTEKPDIGINKNVLT